MIRAVRRGAKVPGKQQHVSASPLCRPAHRTTYSAIDPEKTQPACGTIPCHHVRGVWALRPAVRSPRKGAGMRGMMQDTRRRRAQRRAPSPGRIHVIPPAWACSLVTLAADRKWRSACPASGVSHITCAAPQSYNSLVWVWSTFDEIVPAMREPVRPGAVLPAAMVRSSCRWRRPANCHRWAFRAGAAVGAHRAALGPAPLIGGETPPPEEDLIGQVLADRFRITAASAGRMAGL